MFVIFGEGKCPLCGDTGQKLSKETYRCGRCEIAFNEYYISLIGEPRQENKFWT